MAMQIGAWLVGAAVLLAGSVLRADDWTREMFDHVEHNFGAVARGAKAEHRFRLQNIWVEDVHIASVTSTCGCTKPSVTQTLLKTWQTAEIVATLDTRTFMGHKEAAIKVKFDLPFLAEQILRVSCDIRKDIVVTPGEIQFNAVAAGSQETRKVVVSYAGRPDWAVRAIEANTRWFNVQAYETARVGSQINYEITVGLKKEIPAGYIKDQLVLLTNDANPREARVPVPIEVLVSLPVEVHPSPLMFGVVPAGQQATRSLVIQGKTPFRVLRAECADPRFTFQLPSAAGLVHMLPVTFAAGASEGSVNQVIRITTDAVAGSNLAVDVQARIVATGASAPPASTPTTPIVTPPAPLATPGGPARRPTAPVPAPPAPVTPGAPLLAPEATSPARSRAFDVPPPPAGKSVSPSTSPAAPATTPASPAPAPASPKPSGQASGPALSAPTGDVTPQGSSKGTSKSAN